MSTKNYRLENGQKTKVCDPRYIATFVRSLNLINVTFIIESKETGYLQKDLSERYFKEARRWLCTFNNVPEKEYTHVMTRALEECEDYKTYVRSLYFSAQKPL